MAKRPKISDDLHEAVHDIHREYTGSAATGFEPALKTVVQLAEANILDRNGIEPGWYPGKYIDEVVDRLSSDDSTDAAGTDTTTGSADNSGISVDPDSQAVFKAIVDKEGRITVPEAERAALNLTENELLQVIAYPVDNE